MQKKANLKARGIRFPDEVWKKLSDDAEKKSSTPSDIVRVIIDSHYQTTASSKAENFSNVPNFVE